MSINTETLNRRLFKILSKYKPKPLDVNGDTTDVEDEADVFKFQFTKDGESYGDVYATIDNNRALNLYFDDSVSESPSSPTPGLDYNDTWKGLTDFLKSWAMRNQLSWNPDNNKDHLVQDMGRRKHMKKKEQVAEGYHAMGKKASYSDSIPTIKMVIQHNREIQEGEQRYRNVARIFLENSDGERILAPTTKPGVASIYARHLAEGGKPHDERWNHITGLCEEYNKMAGFVRATRNGQFTESAQSLVSAGINHYQKLRESLSKMRGHRGYNMYFESWTPPLMEDDGDTSNINELFVQETLDPRIESVMPILSKLHKTVAEMKEVGALAEWADSLLEGGDGGEASEEQDKFTSGDAGEGGAEDSPADNLSEEESLTSNNPGGIPEGMLGNPGQEDNPVVNAITRRILLQRTDLLSKHGPEKVMNAIDEVADFVGDVEEIGSSDVSGWIKQVEQMLGNMEQGVAEGYDRSVDIGQQMANDGITYSPERENEIIGQIAEYMKRSGFSNKEIRYLMNYSEDYIPDQLSYLPKEKGMAEDLDSNQKRVGQLGPTEKVKNNNIGKLVGANENFINTDAQAVVTEEEGRPYVCVHAKKGKCNVTANSSYEAAQKAAKKWGLKSTSGIDAHLADVKKDPASLEEGKDDLAAMLRIINR